MKASALDEVFSSLASATPEQGRERVFEEIVLTLNIGASIIVFMNNDSMWGDLADLFKVFGDSSRIRILYKLLEEEYCVQDLAESLCMTQSAVSHQLKVLKMSKLVKNRRDGKQIYYSLADDHVSTILSMGKEHLEEML